MGHLKSPPTERKEEQRRRGEERETENVGKAYFWEKLNTNMPAFSQLLQAQQVFAFLLPEVVRGPSIKSQHLHVHLTQLLHKATCWSQLFQVILVPIKNDSV